MFMIGITSPGGATPSHRPPRLSARSNGSVRAAAAFSTPPIARMRAVVLSRKR